MLLLYVNLSSKSCYACQIVIKPCIINKTVLADKFAYKANVIVSYSSIWLIKIINM